jgi:hypothetical protein
MRSDLKWLPKDCRKPARHALNSGWVLVRKRKHPALVSPCGTKTIVCAGTQSDVRQVRNFKRELRSHGIAC